MENQQAKPAGDAPLKLKLNNDLKDAMRQQNTVRRDTIRLVISALKYLEMEKQTALSDIDIIGVIAKEIKKHHESIDAYKKGNRADLVNAEEAELAVLNSYMPQQMSRDEITAEVKKVIEETGAKGPNDKGKVMQKLMPVLKGKADGREINEVVTELLK